MSKQINHGLDLTRELNERSETDWQFGALSQPCVASIPEKDREKYLPKGEVQFGYEDFMDCATRAPINILEAKLNWLYKNGKLKNKEFFEKYKYINAKGDIELSDRFNAILSGTTRTGNSLIAPLKSIRADGVIPKWMLPADKNMRWEQYHAPVITKEMREIGQMFKERIEVNYERVHDIHFSEALKDDFIDVAGHAWPSPQNGIYPRNNGAFNHAWVNFKNRYFAFDNYTDPFDGDFIKNLAPDYRFYEEGYRVFISKERSPEEIDNQKSLMKLIIEKIKQLIGLYETQTVVPVVPVIPVVKTNLEKLHEIARSFLGKDPSPKDLAHDNLGCSESVSNIVKVLYKDFPIITGTWTLWDKLNKDKRFKKTDNPVAGTIIISPTGTGNGKIKNGHVGVFTDKGMIMSTNSDDGLFAENYTLKGWKDYYQIRGGYPTHFFDVV